MPKTEVEAQFDYLVSKVIWPYFKKRGYRKTGNNFRCLHPDGSGKMLQFQKSAAYNKQHIHFTLNLGLYLPEGQQWAGHSPKFDEPSCLIRRRIGQLQPAGKDHWYDLTAATPTAALYQAVEHDVVTYGLPFLDQVSSRQDVLQGLLDGSRRADDLAVQLRVLCLNGHQPEARQQVQEALTRPLRANLKAYLERTATELGLL